MLTKVYWPYNFFIHVLARFNNAAIRSTTKRQDVSSICLLNSSSIGYCLVTESIISQVRICFFPVWQ